MTNKNKPDWNDLQNEQAYTNAWQIDKIWTTAKKLPVYFWVMFILLAATLGNTLRMYYAMQDMVKVQFEKTETNRGIAKKYIGNNREVVKGLREKIELLNSIVERAQKKNAGMREAIQRKDATIAKAKSQDLAQQMLNEAYQTIAMNAVPLNLQQYLGVASDEQWIGYAEMAAERNSYNVIKTIKSIPALMKIVKVASIVNDYSQAMELTDNE
jgi:DNA transposition AAA+ family ATPase